MFGNQAQLPWEKLRQKVRQDLEVAEQAAQPAYESLGRLRDQLINGSFHGGVPKKLDGFC